MDGGLFGPNWTRFDVLSGFPRWRRSFLGHAVDRLFADQRISAGIEIKGDKLAGQTVLVLRVGIHDSNPIVVMALIS